MKDCYPSIGLARICRLFGISRQAYYQHIWYVMDQKTENEIVLCLIKEIRKEHPRIGTRKIYYMIQNHLIKHQIKMGRDALFDLLSSNGLLVKKRKRRVYTTNSHHWLKKYPNLIENIHLHKSNQLWVSDITYIKTKQGFLYLSLITDAFSRKIVGCHIAESLEAVNTLKALKMAVNSQDNKLEGLIHHSDRGLQYCSKDYVELLNDNKIRISMTQSGDPLENPLAERMNGILKEEYLLNHEIVNLKHARNILLETIKLYNEKRPHTSLNFNFPNVVHEQHLEKQSVNQF